MPAGSTRLHIAVERCIASSIIWLGMVHFTPILAFPHRGGRDRMSHFSMCRQYRRKDDIEIPEQTTYIVN